MLASATAVPPTLTSLIVPTAISLAATARTKAIGGSPKIGWSIVPVGARSQKTRCAIPKMDLRPSAQPRILVTLPDLCALCELCGASLFLANAEQRIGREPQSPLPFGATLAPLEHA